MRRLLIAGNWKMNTTVAEGEALAKALHDVDAAKVDVLVAPPFTHLDRVGRVFAGTDVFLGAQNVSEDACGAHTGEVAAEMLADLHVDYVIVGHSECRGRGEDDKTVAKKASRAMEAGLLPIICFGESEAVYGSGERVDFLKKQVKASLEGIKDLDKITLAYEPIWAIGTGKTADAADADSVIGEVRASLDPAIQDKVRILYGGSVKSSNVAGFVSKENIDGVLVGGASLKADEFKAIVREASHA